MKVTATFNEQGLSLILSAETDAEQRMVGAVLNQPREDRQSEVSEQLVTASIGYESHFSHKKVAWLKINVLHNQQRGGDSQP